MKQENKGIATRMRVSGAMIANAVLVPAKIHVVCCGILPASLGIAGGSAAASWLGTMHGQVALAAAVPPVATLIGLSVEQLYRDNKQRRRARRAAKVEQLHNNAATFSEKQCADGCEHSPRVMTMRNFVRQSLVGYGFYLAMQMLWPSSHDADCSDHDHHDHHRHHQHTTVQQHVPHN